MSENSHASVLAQIKQAEEDDDLPEDLREKYSDELEADDE